MLILGIGGWLHDSAASLLRDGEIVAAVEEAAPAGPVMGGGEGLGVVDDREEAVARGTSVDRLGQGVAALAATEAASIRRRRSLPRRRTRSRCA